jgi:hypothetical protein
MFSTVTQQPSNILIVLSGPHDQTHAYLPHVTLHPPSPQSLRSPANTLFAVCPSANPTPSPSYFLSLDMTHVTHHTRLSPPHHTTTSPLLTPSNDGHFPLVPQHPTTPDLHQREQRQNRRPATHAVQLTSAAGAAPAWVRDLGGGRRGQRE